MHVTNFNINFKFPVQTRFSQPYQHLVIMLPSKLKIQPGQVRSPAAHSQWRAQEFCSGGGVQQIQLRTEDREKGDVEAVAP